MCLSTFMQLPRVRCSAHAQLSCLAFQSSSTAAASSSQSEQLFHFRASLTAGTYIDCSDSRGAWRTAVVKDVSKNAVRVGVVGRDDTWDESRTRDSPRIQPYNTRAGAASWKRQRSSIAGVL